MIDDWDSNDRCKVSPIAGQDGVAAGAGAVSATVQRMTLASDDPAVASLALLDDIVSSGRAQANLIVGQAGIAGGTGTDGATVPRVTLATNVALPAGTNVIGALVDPPITSSPGTNVASSATVVTLLAANASRRRISIANDSTATLYIKKGSGASLTDYWLRLDPLDQLSCWAGECGVGILTGIWSAANGNARIVEDT